MKSKTKKHAKQHWYEWRIGLETRLAHELQQSLVVLQSSAKELQVLSHQLDQLKQTLDSLKDQLLQSDPDTLGISFTNAFQSLAQGVYHGHEIVNKGTSIFASDFQSDFCISFLIRI